MTLHYRAPHRITSTKVTKGHKVQRDIECAVHSLLPGSGISTNMRVHPGVHVSLGVINAAFKTAEYQAMFTGLLIQ